MSEADLDVVELGIIYRFTIASDDLTLRKFAKSLNLIVTGSLGILRRMYVEHFIGTHEEYRILLYDLSHDVFLTKNLIDWALNTSREE